MAKYRITGPDGGTYEVTAPDGASESDVLSYVQQNAGAKQSIPTLTADPTEGMSTTEKVVAGAGKGMTSGLRALGMGGLVERFGLPGTQQEAERLDAPLESTTSGKVGSAIGLGALAAPIALVPGANTYAGATLLGGLSGAALTEGGIGDRAQGAALGAAGGAAGKAVGDVLGKAVPAVLNSRSAERAAMQAANAQKDAAALSARQAGYVLPPADVKGGAINEALNGLSGKIKTAQVASARNQGVTDELARKALGMSAGDVLDDVSLQAIRNNAAQVGYTPVRQSGTVTADKSFITALDNIASTSQGASRSFPGLKNNGVQDVIDTLKQPTFDAGDAVDATRVLRDMADDAYRKGDKTLGKAYKSASQAVEEQLERHLQATGAPDALKSFREARQLIAKTYTVQSATNKQTGNVSAQALAKQLEKGKPLSGDLKTIAQVAQAFPKATQALKEAPKATSPLDWAVSGVTGATTGNPAALALLAARPAARSLLLSKPYQAAMLNPNYGPGLLDAALPLLGSETVRRGMLPMGIGGLLSVPANQ